MSKPTCRELLEHRQTCEIDNCPRLDELASRVERVLALHKRFDGDYGSVCVPCDEWWPCPTVRALDGEE